jgi:hypothetical protein
MLVALISAAAAVTVGPRAIPTTSRMTAAIMPMMRLCILSPTLERDIFVESPPYDLMFNRFLWRLLDYHN